MLCFVPGRRAGEQELDGDAEDAQVAKGACKDGRSTWCGVVEKQASYDKRPAKVAEPVWNPGKDVKNRVRVRRQDARDCCSKECGLKSGKYID